MKVSNSLIFQQEFRKISAEQAQRWTKVLENAGIVNLTFPGTEIGFSKIRTWDEYFRLSIIQWYLPDIYRFYVYLHLLEKSSKFGPDKEIVALTILSSEPVCLLYIEESAIFKNTREFFGFILRNTDWSKYRLYKVLPRKPKKVQRKLGYDDHGSRRPDHKWLPRSDWSLDQLQNEIEKRRETIKNIADLIEGGLS